MILGGILVKLSAKNKYKDKDFYYCFIFIQCQDKYKLLVKIHIFIFISTDNLTTIPPIIRLQNDESRQRCAEKSLSLSLSLESACVNNCIWQGKQINQSITLILTEGRKEAAVVRAPDDISCVSNNQRIRKDLLACA